MKPVTKDLALYQGDSYQLFFRIRRQVWDGAQYVPGDYRNLTGATGKAQIRATAADATVLAEFTVALADQTSPDTVGGVLLTLTPTQTTGLTLPTAGGVWDVQIAYSANEVRTYMKGKVTMDAEVTRA